MGMSSKWRSGIYKETVAFSGKALRITSQDP